MILARKISAKIAGNGFSQNSKQQLATHHLVLHYIYVFFVSHLNFDGVVVVVVVASLERGCTAVVRPMF